MKKHIAWSLAFLLVSMSMLPAAYADETEAAAETTPAAEVQGEPAVKQTEEVKPVEEVKAEKTANDYEDLKVLPTDAIEKFNFFIQQDTFEPDSKDTFGVNKLITREEFVKASRAIFSTPAGTDATVPPFFDNYLSLGLINKDGLVVDGDDPVTRQDLAKFLIYGLDKVADAKKTEPITDTSYQNFDGVTLAASRYVTLAMQLNIVKNQEDGHYGGDRKATRRMLVEAGFEARKIFAEINEKSKLSISEAKAVGAKKLGVTFNKVLDLVSRNRVVLTVKKDGADIAGTLEWAPDNKSVTITVDQKLKKGTYTVDLSGLDESSIEKKSAEITAEDEQIKGLEFVNSSDNLPRSKVTIDFKQTNQYGEPTDATAQRFQIYAGSGNTVQPVVNKQAFRLDLSKEKRDARISISIMDREHNLSLNKIFTVGDHGIVTKIEMGDIKYKDNTILKPGNKAYLSFFAYDQYGYRMEDPEDLNKGIMKMYDGETLFEKSNESAFVDFDNDGYLDMELTAISNVKRETGSTLKLMAVGSGQIASKKITIFTPKVAASLEIKELTRVLAEGDKDVAIELVVRDAEGYEFSQAERKALFDAGEITVRTSGRLNLSSVVNGNISIANVTGTGAASIEARLNKENKTATANYTLMTKRQPQVLEKSGFDPAFVFTVVQTTSASAAFIVKDQYDEPYSLANPEYQIRYTLVRTGGDAGAFTGVYNSKIALNDANPSLRVAASDGTSKSVSLTATANKLGSYQMTATLLKVKPDSTIADSTKWPIVSELSSITARAQSYTMNDLKDDLTYSLNTSKSMFAVGKYLVDQGLKVNKDNKGTASVADQADAVSIFNTRDALTQGIGDIRAYNKDGVETSTTGVSIASVQIADPKIMAVNKNVSPTKIVGLNPGNTVMMVTINTPNGMKVLKENFSVFTSNLTPGSLTQVKLGTGNKNVPVNDINGRYIWYTSLLSKIQVSDGDGVFFTNSATENASKQLVNNEGLTPFMAPLQAQFILSDITYASGTKESDKDTLYMTDDYKLVFIPKSGVYNFSKVNLRSFKLTVKAASKSTSVTFTVN